MENPTSTGQQKISFVLQKDTDTFRIDPSIFKKTIRLSSVKISYLSFSLFEWIDIKKLNEIKMINIQNEKFELGRWTLEPNNEDPHLIFNNVHGLYNVTTLIDVSIAALVFFTLGILSFFLYRPFFVNLNLIKNSFFILLITLGIPEITLRIAGFYYLPMKIKVENFQTNDWRQYHSFEDKYFIFDSSLIWKPKQSTAIFNSLGYRGALVGTTDKKNVIVVLGDSNSLGPNGPPGWAETIEMQHADKIGYKKIVNLSAWGYSSFQGMKRIEEFLSLEPTHVLISFGANDGHKVFLADKNYLRIGYLPTFLSNFRIYSLLFAIRDKFLLRDGQGQLENRVSYSDFEENINSIIKMTNSINGIPILLTRPFNESKSPGHYLFEATKQYNSILHKLSSDKKIPIFDLEKYFRGKDEYFVDAYHFNKEGYRIAAEKIASYLASL